MIKEDFHIIYIYKDNRGKNLQDLILAHTTYKTDYIWIRI